MKLPRLYRPVNIRFWSLRDTVGCGLGVIPDCDVLVERVCLRVRTRDAEGWKWQLCANKLHEWNYLEDVDKESLDNSGSDLEFELVKEEIK